MTATLTQRYIAAAIDSLPPASQDDVRAELEASIADAVEARIDQGEQPAAAERAALNELGDPAILAAGYADRPLHLIGPRYYPTWWRLLKLLLVIVPLCVLGAVALGKTLAADGTGEIIGQSIVAALSTAVHLCFWVTLVFVVLERTGAGLPEWNVDNLPEAPESSAGRVNLIASLAFLAFAVGALLWDQSIGFIRVASGSVPVLNPGLWPWSMAGFLALLAAEAAFAVVLFLRRRWSIALAVANTVISVLFTSLVLTLLASGQLANPEFLALVTQRSGEADLARIIGVVVAFSVLVIGVWDMVDGWRKAAREHR